MTSKWGAIPENGPVFEKFFRSDFSIFCVERPENHQILARCEI